MYLAESSGFIPIVAASNCSGVNRSLWLLLVVVMLTVRPDELVILTVRPELLVILTAGVELLEILTDRAQTLRFFPLLVAAALAAISLEVCPFLLLLLLFLLLLDIFRDKEPFHLKQKTTLGMFN